MGACGAGGGVGVVGGWWGAAALWSVRGGSGRGRAHRVLRLRFWVPEQAPQSTRLPVCTPPLALRNCYQESTQPRACGLLQPTPAKRAQGWGVGQAAPSTEWPLIRRSPCCSGASCAAYFSPRGARGVGCAQCSQYRVLCCACCVCPSQWSASEGRLEDSSACSAALADEGRMSIGVAAGDFDGDGEEEVGPTLCLSPTVPRLLPLAPLPSGVMPGCNSLQQSGQACRALIPSFSPEGAHKGRAPGRVCRSMS